MTNTSTTPEALRKEAADLDRRADESFERCDTDGALTQWASQVTARERRAEAAILENGGKARFAALFDLDGNLVPAWTVKGRYGLCFVVKTEWDRDADPVEFVAIAKRMATFEKKGYRLGVIERPAGCKLHTNFVGDVGSVVVFPLGWDATEIDVIHNGVDKTVDEIWEIRNHG